MKLITWNIQWCRGVDGRVDPARIIEHARALADFDVLCLQEVAANFASLRGSRGENQFELLARALPGHTAVHGIAVDTPIAVGDARRGGFGNMILSRYPVLQVLRSRLPWPSDPGVKSMPRMLLEATLETPFGPVRVMTTHLEYYSAVQRAAQVQAIRDSHAEACARAAEGRHRDGDGPFHRWPETRSAILTADFNFRPEDPLHAKLQEPFDEGPARESAGIGEAVGKRADRRRAAPVGASASRLVDAWQHLNPGQPHAATIGVHDRAQWPSAYTCDFIFASEDLLPHARRLAVGSDTAASDHQPVLLELD